MAIYRFALKNNENTLVFEKDLSLKLFGRKYFSLPEDYAIAIFLVVWESNRAKIRSFLALCDWRLFLSLVFCEEQKAGFLAIDYERVDNVSNGPHSLCARRS